MPLGDVLGVRYGNILPLSLIDEALAVVLCAECDNKDVDKLKFSSKQQEY